MVAHEVDPGRLRGIVDAFPTARVLVLGDIIVDHYLWGTVQRISPEAPVPVVEVREENRRLGGAANVANNIRRLEGTVDLVGVVGQDEDGEWLLAELAQKGIGGEGVVRQPGRPTTVKTRIIAHSQQMLRFDRETRDGPAPRTVQLLKSFLRRRLRAGEVVVVSDYGKGVVSHAVLQFLREQKADLGLRVCVDPKSRHFSVYRDLTLVTPNQREAELAAGMEIADGESLERAGRKLMEVLSSDALLITRGEHGMSLFQADRTTHIPTMAREVYDVTGAGDTVLATLSLALAAGADFFHAAYLSNLAAGIVVGELGTSTVSPAELREALDHLPPAGQGGRR
jgi:D-beta-D-heptose 7-phosphate kinase/D-beta-D-heptose 1-phosphate adenosyltransferase